MKIAPSFAIRSRLGVLLIEPGYVPIVRRAWSSLKMNRIFGCKPALSVKVDTGIIHFRILNILIINLLLERRERIQYFDHYFFGPNTYF